MQILDDRQAWQKSYESGWLAHWRATGELDWGIYQRPRNAVAPAGPGIDLSRSRMTLISTAGAYLPASQPPFDAAHPLGDYSVRTFPSSTPFSAIDIAHGHYDHAAVRQDPQVLLPLRHLEALATAGEIGELAPSVISIMGYQPDVTRLLDETIPAVLDIVLAEQAHAALLVPA